MIAKPNETKLSMTRWSADWKSATSLYEQAAIGFRLAKKYEKAKEAFEKASKGQEMQSSPWDAAKHMESAAALAKELGNWSQVADFYRRASELYNECDRAQPASDALAKGARNPSGEDEIRPFDGRVEDNIGNNTSSRLPLILKSSSVPLHSKLPADASGNKRNHGSMTWGPTRSEPPIIKLQLKTRTPPLTAFLVRKNHFKGKYSALEDAQPEEAIKLYIDACATLEEDDKQQMAFDLYRAAMSVYIKLEKYTDAATFLLRWGLAADKSNATHSQCKAYLSAIIVYLYAHDFQEAEKCYNDCSQVNSFLSSDQYRCASKLLSAYTDGDIEEIKHVAQSSTISNLDHAIIKLARKLPTGDVSAMKASGTNQEEPLDEDDLT
ncbi:hypothetical protein LguiB_004632 [Lonicera macranthoides]